MFKRYLTDNTIDGLRRDKLFTERLEPDIQKRNVFPAIRQGRVDFYHKGGKIFSYQNGFSTHKKYASAIRSNSDYISESDLQQKVKVITNFFDGYEQIKENCSLYSWVEAEGISRIYHKYPFTNNDLVVVVLDIEISFEAKSEERSQDRIDILLFNKKTQELRFYETKHYSNSELWAVEGTSPRAVSQIQQYEEQIQEKGKDILSEYCNYVRIVNDLFGCGLPEPKSIDNKVTLLVFGYDRDQKRGRMQKLLLDDGSLAGIQRYFIGNISAVNIDNMWKAVKCG
jgi:hypothetical protein